MEDVTVSTDTSGTSEGVNAVPSAKPTIFDKALGLNVTFTKIGNSKSVHRSLITIDADKDLIKANKKLLESPELKAINQLDREARGYLDSRCLPSPLRAGIYLIPIGMVSGVNAALEDFAAKRKELVAGFKAVYPSLIDKAQNRLRVAFDPMDYPPVERLEEAFDLSWQYISFGVPGQLKSISAALFEAEQQKAEVEWIEAMAECKSLLRASFAELVDHMIDRLTGNAEVVCEHCESGKIDTGERVECEACGGAAEIEDSDDYAIRCYVCEGTGYQKVTTDCGVCNGTGRHEQIGKPKTFKNSLIANMGEFLSLFADKNIADDAELSQLVGQAQMLIEGVSPEHLRPAKDGTIPEARTKLAEGMVRIKATLDSMVIAAPDRMIRFDDE